MSRLKNQFEFMAAINFDGEQYFNKYLLSIDFYTLDGTPEDENIAMDRIAYFMYDTVARSTFIDEGDMEKINLLTKAGLPVLTLAHPAIDPVILATLVTKMNTIAEGLLVITEAEIISELGGPLVYVWDEADEEDELHATINDSDITKWWASPAPRFGSYPEGVDVAVVEEKSPFPLTWEMLKLGWQDEFTEEDVAAVITAVKKPSKKKSKIIKADFKRDPKKPTK